MTAVAPSAAHIGRFRVLRPLGQGAQGVVYAAHDPELDRTVAIKTLTLDTQADPAQAEQLLATARTASSLSHPNIVPVFEVGMHAGRPFVVFEYVEGRTLADILQAEGALSMAQAVVMMSQILAGMAHVHASGLLHGDIKPANILVGANGIPRVADFGISRHAIAASGQPVYCGTVQYTAPECLTESRADYRSDVFALGLLFHEMLTGKPVFEAESEYALIYRILNEVPPPPSALNPRIDRRLDEIVLKALNRDPAKRYADAGDMKRHLDRYRVPGTDADLELREPTVHATAEFLLRRMAIKSDFPALSASFSRINRLAHDPNASIQAIAKLVMRDLALSQKLLRLVNSAAFGVGKVTRVSDAITLLGLAQLRALATSMMLAASRDTPRWPAIAAALTDSFVAGVISRNVGRLQGLDAVVEELFICGMFSRLGEILTLYYLSDEYDAIMTRVTAEGMDSSVASRAVLGLSFEELGAEVARHWKFPDLIVDAMRALPPGPVPAPESEEGRMSVCAAYARELCTLLRETPAAEREAALARHSNRFAAAVPVNEAQLRLLIGHSVTAAQQYIAAAGLKLVRTPLLDAMKALADPSTLPKEAVHLERAEAANDAGEARIARADALAAPALSTAAPRAPTATATRSVTGRLRQALRALFYGT